MNLVQQFPDISERIRAKIKHVQKPVNAGLPLRYNEDAVVAAYYEGQFRRWHVKLMFIVSACLVLTYLGLLNSAWIMNYFHLASNHR